MQDRVVIFDSRVEFLGTPYLTASLNLPPNYPCCHGNEIWDKIGYNSACIREIPEIYAYNRGFSGSGYWLTADKSYRHQPLLPWQRNFGKIGYNSAYIRDIHEIFACITGVLEVGLLIDARQILPRPTPVAMATKCGAKSAISRLLCEITRRSLRPTGCIRSITRLRLRNLRQNRQ